MYVLYHGKPRLDGASGFTSNLYTEFRRDMQEFPSPAAVERAYDMGARRVIVHYGDFPPPGNSTVRLRIEAAPRLHEVAAFGGDVVYEIVQPDAR